VEAYDDTVVARVHVKITDDYDNLLEEGDAVQADGLWWDYTTQTQITMASTPKVLVTVTDLPGNKAELSWTKS
jgi:hypothetical protein